MMFSLPALFHITAVLTVIAAQESIPTLTEPCAIVSSSAAAYLADLDNAFSAKSPEISAELAFECLNSVPLGASQAVDLVNAIIPYMQWQSTLEILKDPPSGYHLPGVDLLGGLDTISKNVTQGNYKNEYEFEIALYNLFNSAHDFHTNYFPDFFGNSFAFKTGVAIVSVSTDGQELPQLYFYGDVSRNVTNSSPIKMINGIDAATWVEQFSLSLNYNDRDALYNAVLFSLANLRTGSQGSFASNEYRYLGPNTTFSFANGSTLTFQNKALVTGNFTGVDSGAAFYQKFCTPAPPPTEPVNETTIDSHVPVPGYPDPIEADSQNFVIGYFLNSTGYEDVAVLSMTSFENGTSSATVAAFLAACKEAGKTKLVVDLSANGGGSVFLGYEVFKQLFPSIEFYSASNSRAAESIKEMDMIFSALYGQYADNTTFLNENAQYIASADQFVYQFKLTDQETDFSSFEEYFGPHAAYGDNFTSLSQYNFSVPFLVLGYGHNVTGYGNNTEIAPQVFDSENVVILYDGLCGSTCAIFSEFMTQQAHVKTVAARGRPIASPMQGVGGSKGSLVYDFSEILQLSQTSKMFANQTGVQTNAIDQLTSLPIDRSPKGSLPRINARNQIRMGDTSDTPLQFYYQAAQCRIFYTPAMITDVTAQWKTVADIAFNGKTSLCVNGSTGDPSSNPTNGTLNATASGTAGTPAQITTASSEGSLMASSAVGILGLVATMFLML